MQAMGIGKATEGTARKNDSRKVSVFGQTGDPGVPQLGLAATGVDERTMVPRPLTGRSRTVSWFLEGHCLSPSTFGGFFQRPQRCVGRLFGASWRRWEWAAGYHASGWAGLVGTSMTPTTWAGMMTKGFAELSDVLHEHKKQYGRLTMARRIPAQAPSSAFVCAVSQLSIASHQCVPCLCLER